MPRAAASLTRQSPLRALTAACSRLRSGIAATLSARDADIWVIHAFQKKSKSGVKTPQMHIDLIRERLKRLKKALQ
jgi:hypothetical protein